MKVEILGPGCQKCKRLAENAELAMKELGGDIEIVKVTDIDQIVKSGVMMTPGLAIDGKVKSAGRILSVEEIKKVIRDAGN